MNKHRYVCSSIIKANTISHIITQIGIICQILEELFKEKPHLGVLLKGRRWGRVKARLKRVSRLEVQ